MNVNDYIDAEPRIQEEPLSIDTGEQNMVPSQSTASMRAVKAQFGLAQVLPKSYEELYRYISNGEEANLRKAAASNWDAANAEKTQQTITGIAGTPVGDVQQKLNLINVELNKNKPVDPRSVIEQGFSDQFADHWNSTNTPAASFWSDAQREMPLGLEQGIGLTKETMSYRQYVLKKIQDANDAMEKQDYLGMRGVNLGLTMLQPYVEIKQRLASGHLGSPLLGTELEAQAQAALARPFDQFKDGLDKTIDPLIQSNPYLALQRLNYLAGAATSERYLDNIFTVAAIPDWYTLAKGTTGIAKGIYTRNQFNKAAKSMIQAAADDTRPPSVVAPAAAGDLNVASTETAARIVENNIKGTPNPYKDALEGVVSGLRNDLDNIKKDPGNYGQEQVNRMTEDYEGFITKVTNAITNITRVERIPGFIATRKAINAYKESMAQFFPKLSILDVADPVHDIPTNTYHWEIHLGNNGEHFSNPQTAYNAAELNGLTPARETLLQQVNKTFGDESSKINGQIRAVQAEIKSGPRMDADVHELNRHAALPQQLEQLQRRMDDLLSWHADRLTEPGIDKIIMKEGPGYSIENAGKGYYIKVIKPLNETENIVRDSLLATKNAQTPESLAKDFLGRFRTPDEQLSFDQNLNRKIAAYGKSVFDKLMQENAEYITQLNRGVIKTDPITGEKINFLSRKLKGVVDITTGRAKKWQTDWLRVVDAGRYLLDKDGKPGRWFETPGEFERFYIQNIKRPPEPIETAAYFAFRRHYEADHMFRKLDLYKHFSRLGAEEHSISGLNANHELTESPYFAGVLRKELPGGDDTIAIVKRILGQETIDRTDAFKPREAQKYRKDVKDGVAKLIEIVEPDNFPLKGYGEIKDERVRYVLVYGSPKTRPLNADNLLPRRGGGHIEYDYDNYIKQAIIHPENIGGKFKHWYLGDRTIMPMGNRALGQKMAAHMDQVRQFIKDDNLPSAKAYARAHLPIEWDEFHGYFLPHKDEKGVIHPPQLNKDEPIQVIKRNGSIGNTNNELRNRYTDLKDPKKSTFADGTRGGSLASQFRVDFTSPRDAERVTTINDYGTKNNPLYKHEPAKMIDPMVTMTRSFNKISNSIYMDDYKIFSVEHWLREAAPYLNLKDKPESDLRAAPFYHFYKHEYLLDVPQQVRTRLENRHYQIKSFIGEPSAIDTALQQTAQNLADWTYNKYGNGPTILGKRVNLAPVWALQHITSPFEFLKTVTHHASLGFFNPSQILAQGATIASITGIAGPVRATQGTMAAILHQMYRMSNHSPELLKILDGFMSKLNIFKDGEFTEAMQHLSSTGFENVGAEHSMLERMYQPKMVTNGFQNFLHSGDIFFKGTERMIRYASWYTAYKDFRAANPTKAISNYDKLQILEKADILSGNMSRASRSVLQKGILSYPSQFLGYQMRMAELFTGTRIDALQRARLLTTYAVMFGFPSAMGLSAFPAGDYLRKWAMENGYQPGDKAWSTTLMEGVLSTSMAYITGAGDWKNVSKRISSGNIYNVGQRYGSPGFDFIRDALDTDTPFWRIAGGAPGQTFANTWNTTLGPRQALLSMVRGDNEKYPIKADDFNDILKNISTYNSAWKTIAAINTAKWLSKNETVLDKGISVPNALFMGASGMSTQRASDTQQFSILLKDEQAAQKYAGQVFIKEYHRYLQALDNGDAQQAADYYKRGRTVLEAFGYPEELRDHLAATASRDRQTLYQRLEEQLHMKNVPTDKTLTNTVTGGPTRKEEYFKMHQRAIQLDELQGK